jgi:hypothetical protein
MFMRGTRIAVYAGLALSGVALAGCGLMSDDRYGVYADGDNYVVVDQDHHRINFTTGSQDTPEVLLADAAAGKGLGFTTWRNGTSCGLHDDRGNNFVVPRGVSRLDYGGATFVVDPVSPGITAANGGQAPHEKTIRMLLKGQVRMTYVYDDTLGVRSIDRYDSQAHVERTIVLLQGTGLLAHCRGFSTDDFKK